MVGRREGAIALLVGVLAVAALSGIYGDPAPDAPGDGSGTGASTPVDAESQKSAMPVTIPGWTARAVVVATAGVGTVFTAIAAVAVLWFRGVDGLKRIVRLVAELLAGTGLYVLLMLVFIGLVFGFSGAGLEIGAQPAGGGTGGASGGAGGQASEAGPTDQHLLLAAGVVAALALVVVAVVRHVRDDVGAFDVDGTDEDDGSELADANPPEDDPEPIGDVAPSNGVFRAWRRMADAVDEATDRTLTTGEVATAAVERGLDREAVDTLTTAFEEVRYGDRPATSERERRAEAAAAALSLDGGDEE